MKGQLYPIMICTPWARDDQREGEPFTECLWHMDMNGDAPVLRRKCPVNKISYIITAGLELPVE
jgi:hypothetical protein